MIYTHISDKYAPFHSKVVNVGVRDSTYVLDGLLYHESDIRITEHYTDTNGFTDRVFGLMHLLGYRFAPRIRDLADTRIYTPNRDGNDILKPLIGGTLNLKHLSIRAEPPHRSDRAVEHRVPERATRAINTQHPIDGNLLQHLSPLGWEHINLTGDYTWKTRRNANTTKYRPLRPFPNP